MDIGSIECNMYVDISGQDCTLPSSKFTEAIAALAPGMKLLAVTQKENVQSNVPAYCQQMNLQLLDQGEDDQQFYFLIQK